MIAVVFVFTLIATAGLWMLLRHHQPERDTKRRIILRIDEILPQTQCRQCGYAGCLPYAEAVVVAGAPIDQCPPGGQVVRRSLAELLGRSAVSLNRMADSPLDQQVVKIDEQSCIGCTKCIQACPVDAIVGATKQMHTVIRGNCTGCELCIPPCPVDCIDLVNLTSDLDHWRWTRPTYGGPERRVDRS